MLSKEIQDRLIGQGRDFTRGHREDDPYEEEFESDQDLKRPQPPLVKTPVTPRETHIPLTRDFQGILIKTDLTEIIRDRRSSRVYTGEPVSLEQLSYMLWSTQGIKDIRGKSYATLRTVPCGGARHQFETYLIVRNVSGLTPGAYHYLPMEHTLEFLGPVNEVGSAISNALCDQSWAAKASLVLCWSMVAYRAEWRYGIYAHRVAMMDIGHVGENLYLACTGLGLGTCGVGAFSHELLCGLFGLDGEEEYPVYAMPVGTVKDEDNEAEQAFYQFVQDEGL